MAMQESQDRRLVHFSGPAEIVTDDLDQLLEVLPPHICDPVVALPDRRDLKVNVPGGFRPWAGSNQSWPPSDPRAGWATTPRFHCRLFFAATG